MHLELPADQLKTAQDPDTDLCVVDGVGHDFRPNHYTFYNRSHISLVCVWCHGVACGDPDQADPCLEIYHHSTPHRTRTGATWAIGGSRPDGVTA